MEKEVIQVEIPAGKKAAWVDGFLKLVDAEEEQKKDERPITERVKTFEDACKELGEDHKLVQQFKAIQEAIAEDKEATAYFKLGIITAALNEGWEPDFTNDDEYRYYPYLCLWTKEELEDKDEEWKDDHNLQLWVGGGTSAAVRIAVSLLRTRTTPGRMRMRPSRLGLHTRQRSWQFTAESNSRNYGRITQQERRQHHGEISRT
nr:MAG: hypothetical protein [Bacteriophage sp.]